MDKHITKLIAYGYISYLIVSPIAIWLLYMHELYMYMTNSTFSKISYIFLILTPSSVTLLPTPIGAKPYVAKVTM